MAKGNRRTIGEGVQQVTSLSDLQANLSQDTTTDVLDAPGNEQLDRNGEAAFGLNDAPVFEQDKKVTEKAPGLVSAAEILGIRQTEHKELPTDIKVPTLVLRKIPKGTFRLGLEKQEDAPQLMPGAIHKFEPFMQGNQYLTDLAKKPKDRARLENILKVDLSPTSEYYSTITYQMYDRPHGQFMVLDDTANGAYEEVVYNCMIASPLIANGLHEYRNGKKPMAEWYIENKEAEAIVESQKVDTELKMFETLALMPDSRRIEIAKIMRLPDAHTGSALLVKTELYKVLKNGNKLMNTQTAVQRFLTISNWDPQKIVVAALVEDAENLNVIRLTKTKDWAYADQILGASKEEVVSFLMAPKSSQIRESIYNKVNLMSK